LDDGHFHHVPFAQNIIKLQKYRYMNAKAINDEISYESSAIQGYVPIKSWCQRIE